jgi:hypothetical protein
MSDQIVLTIPEDISARARQIAETTEQPVEQVLIDHLKTLSTPLSEATPILLPEEQAELDALHQLSDDLLWTIAREQMPEDVEKHAHALMDKNSRGTITDDERAELEKLVERADRLMLRKAEGAAILRERGIPFTQKDFKPPHG